MSLLYPRLPGSSSDGIQSQIDGNFPTAADKVLYSTGAGAWAETGVSANARTFMNSADYAAMRTALGVAIGAQVQGYSALLAAIVALTPAEGTHLVGTAGGSWTSAVLAGLWGDGADGSHTVVGTETLTVDTYYTSLTVPNGTVLQNNGFGIFCTGTLTNNGTVRDNGNDAVANTNGAGLSKKGIRGITGAGGAGRSTNGAGAVGGATHNWNAYADYHPAAGNGGSVSGNAGGNGVSDGTTTVASYKKPIGALLTFQEMFIFSVTNLEERVGTGGGAGACNVGTATAISGGGGGGAGIVPFRARILTGSGTFESKGGAGGNASATGNGAAGGGGGGSGGRIEGIAGSSSNWSGTMSVLGGTHGTGINETAAGTDGSPGVVRFFTLFQ